MSSELATLVKEWHVIVPLMQAHFKIVNAHVTEMARLNRRIYQLCKEENIDISPLLKDQSQPT